MCIETRLHMNKITDMREKHVDGAESIYNKLFTLEEFRYEKIY